MSNDRILKPFPGRDFDKSFRLIAFLYSMSCLADKLPISTFHIVFIFLGCTHLVTVIFSVVKMKLREDRGGLKLWEGVAEPPSEGDRSVRLEKWLFRTRN